MAETMQLDRILRDHLAAGDRGRRGVRALQGQARADRRRVAAHGQLGAGDLAARRVRVRRRRPSIARSTTPMSTTTCAISAATSIPAGCSGAARSRATTATTRKRLASSPTSCGAAAGSAWSAISTTAPASRCRSSARTRKTQAIAAMIARRTGARVWMSRCLRIGKESRFRIELEGAQGAAHGQPGRGCAHDDDRDAAPVRGVGAREPGAVDVEQPALELTATCRQWAGNGPLTHSAPVVQSAHPSCRRLPCPRPAHRPAFSPRSPSARRSLTARCPCGSSG